jgi:hypothetical protein
MGKQPFCIVPPCFGRASAGAVGIALPKLIETEMPSADKNGLVGMGGTSGWAPGV